MRMLCAVRARGDRGRRGGGGLWSMATKTATDGGSLVLLRLAVILWGSVLLRTVVAQQDAECLREFKQSVDDPTGYLESWKFDNGTGVNICTFEGVTCWHDGDSRVQTLKLQGASLAGSFPQGLSKCGSLNSLDLSQNSFTGPISSTLCSDSPYLVYLVLNENQFSDAIPENLGSCDYLNYLYLQNNHLTGNIPVSIGNLGRLKALDVSNNNLNGLIPSNLARKINDSKSYADNPNLCGAPLSASCSGGGKSKNTGLIVGVALGALVVVIAIGLAIWWWFLSRPLGYYSNRDENRWIKRIKAPKSIIVSMFEKPLVKIKLSDLMAATNDFSQSSIIASGRTGTVYKGVLADGSVMAIKRLQVTPHSDRQFRAEMETLGRLKHRNLVPLLGYCIAGSERLLVYKHMPNGNLQDHLHGGGGFSKGGHRDPPVSASQVVTFSDSGNGYGGLGLGEKGVGVFPQKLDWETRLKIAIGGARGLAWLHHSCNPRVIHRNISPSSLLLDEEFEPKISDFGLARLMNPVDTHISTFINGDFGDVGYVAPEYPRTLVATVKGDVYSFGVVLLELVTGKKAVDVTGDNFRGNLGEWIWFLINTGSVSSGIDKSLLTGTEQDDELMQFLKIAASCVVPQPKERPSMYEIFHMLRAIGEKYHFTDQNDEIFLASTTTGDTEPRELIVSNS